MMRLRPYKPCDAEYIVKWCGNEYAFRQWSADRYPKFPITADNMNMYYGNNKENGGLWALTAFDETGVVGHLTMRFPKGNFDEVRFGFVIVDSEKRGRGYGKEMLSLAVKNAFEFVKVKKISLGVFENNTAALQCYKAVGFNVVETDKTESYNCLGETWKCIEMEILK
ncbi:MAG: GNAT family N-acetyltransferase [Oscillospiraceae bacterium]|nr:GNAT family N-acetyltransferase [Oscillospiraceae bacterium]